ncbi:synergin gamma [Caerostris extrusa]|uniref:Synergin gamma n=1 Tax=Caerostris extrusa TaxID=172846 RepID=A0AAV4S1B7_CAEEX|nr:synergin gamma [Caerostris extrusa]
MSNPVRPSLVGPQPTMSGRMMSPVCATGAPAMISVVPNAYGLIGPQPNSYMQRSNFPQQNIPNRMPLVNAIPGHLPGMYVPVVPMNAGLNHSNMDPAKLLEEQKRLERERNFQMQQQRLKQFTVAGKKGSLNADSLIDSIIGKVQPKTNHTTSSSFAKPSVPTEPVKPIQPRKEFPPSVTVFKQETPPPNIPVNPQKPKKSVGELDAMMRECSDFSGPQKANKFSKPVVKELGPSTQQRYTFTSSNKSRDWKTIQGLDEVFVTKKSRFPQWCSKEYIPDLYKSVETIVTNNGTTAPDTKLLFPILISSGLPQQILGQIWELVNQSAPGQLTLEETYAALALIAVAQAGHPLKTADVLHQLPACPIPQLQCFAVPSQSIPTETNIPPPPSSLIDKNKPATYSASESPDQNTHLVIRPSAISLKEVTNSSNIPNASSEIKKEIAAGSASAGLSGFTSSPDDEFDDFKSATPTAVNFAIATPSSDSLQEDDAFADFKQAPPSC